MRGRRRGGKKEEEEKEVEMPVVSFKVKRREE